MSYFGVSTRNGVGLSLGTVPSLTNTPLGYRLAPSLNLSFAGSDTLDPRINFSRTTNATLTNSAGLVANAPMNLLTFSEQFDNAAWTKDAVTVTANATIAPDGTATADLVVETVAAGNHRVSRSLGTLQAQSLTVNIRHKAGVGTRNLDLAIVGGSNFVSSVFSTATGAVLANNDFAGVVFSGKQNTVSGPDAQGFYTATITVNLLSAQSVSVIYGLANGTSNSYTGDGVSGIFIWGAQLELGSTATTYNPTTVKNLLGFTENFDNAAWTKSNAFVQTNLLTYSEFANGVTDAPIRGGLVTATTLTGYAGALAFGYDGVTGAFAYKAFAHTAGVSYTLSVLVQMDDGLPPSFANATPTSGLNTFSLIGNGQLAASAAEYVVTLFSGNIYRVSWTYVAAGTNGNTGVSKAVTNNSRTFKVTGYQLVQGTSAGDYKATYAAAAAVGYTDIYGQPFAQKLVENTANAAHIVNVTNIGSVSALETLSFYAKAAERTWCAIQMGSSALAYYDIQNGTIGTQLNGTATITLVGNGWFKCSLTAVRAANGNNNIYTATGNNAVTYTGDGTSGIYIFGAQLSDSASVDPYVYQPVAAPSSVAYYGPRFDYDPVTLAPKGLLIEEQRTNLLTYSEQFDNAAWTKYNATITANSTIAPNGTLTADTYTQAAAGGVGAVFQNVTVSGQNQWSLSAKQGTNRYLALVVGNGAADGGYVVFDLQGGVVGQTVSGTTTTGVSGAISPLANGFFRCTITYTRSSTVNHKIELAPALTGNTIDSFGEIAGNATGQTVFIWGAQLEAGAFATSYIPTVASQVTRAADSASMIGNNFARWYNQGPGTVYAETDSVKGQYPHAVSLQTNSSNSIYLYLQQAGSNYTGNLDVTNAGAVQASLQTAISTASSRKITAAYQVNDFAAVVNAGTAVTDTSGSVPIVTQLDIGNRGGTQFFANGTIKRIAYYNRRLANSELTAITS